MVGEESMQKWVNEVKNKTQPSVTPDIRLIKVGNKVGEKISNNQQAILKLMHSNLYISAKKLSGKIGISSRKIEENIKKLKEPGLIKRIGASKGGH